MAVTHHPQPSRTHWYVDSTTALPEAAIRRSAQAAFDRSGIKQVVHRHDQGVPCEGRCYEVKER